MIEAFTGFQAMRSNPHVLIRGKAAPAHTAQRERMEGDYPENHNSDLPLEEARILEEMQRRDKAVREEEQAHARLLGRHAGAIRYEYQIGPDGKAYVINGSVEVSPKFESSNPEEIRKVLKTIQRAAVAISNPSQADLNVAASAANKLTIANRRAAAQTYQQGIESQSGSFNTHLTSKSQLDTVA